MKHKKGHAAKFIQLLVDEEANYCIIYLRKYDKEQEVNFITYKGTKTEIHAKRENATAAIIKFKKEFYDES